MPPREEEPSLNARNFVLQALEEGVRLDGRTFEDYRSIQLNFGDEYGVADVKMGKTRVLARVTAEVSAPYTDRLVEGIFSISAELGPMLSPAFEPNRVTEAELLLSRALEKTIRRSGALDLESLCLIAGKKVWSIRVDLHVLSHDGNLVDSSCFAAVAALRHFRKPETSIEGGTLTIFPPAQREPVPLSWLHSPLCVTFSFFGGNGNIVLLDTTLCEEQIRAGQFIISLNKHGEICHMFKPGETAVEAVSLLQCSRIALPKVQYLSELMDKSLAEDANRRNKGGLMAELRAEHDR